MARRLRKYSPGIDEPAIAHIFRSIVGLQVDRNRFFPSLTQIVGNRYSWILALIPDDKEVEEGTGGDKNDQIALEYVHWGPAKSKPAIRP